MTANDVAKNAWFTIIGRLAVIAAAPILAVILQWMAGALIDLRGDQKLISSQISSLLSDHYSIRDAQRDFAIRDLKDAQLQQSLDAIKLRLADLDHGYRPQRKTSKSIR